ncbi:MAG: TlpA family protein disulfide reductase [bacterium]|nr:TlpA family protein disulfide reductase [bacterium]
MKKLFLVVMLFVMTMSIFGAQGNIIDFTAVDISGKKIKLSDFNDKVVILDFWATWCPPCRKEIPNLKTIKKTYQKDAFEIISVDGFERKADEIAREFVKTNGMNWVHVIDKKIGVEIAKSYKVPYLPFMLVIKNGKIEASNLRGDALKNKVKELMGK